MPKNYDLLSPPAEFHPQEHSSKMRPTQVAAFKNIKENGLLSRMRFLVYQAIYWLQDDQQGVTSGELDRFISRQIATWTRSPSPRLSELVRLGVIEEIGKRKCSVTGQTVIEYRTTDNLPNPEGLKDYKPKKPSQAVLEDGVEEMRKLHQLALNNGYTPKESYIEIGQWLAGLLEH